MDPQAFSLLMARFDTLEEQNRQQLELMAKHVELDEGVHGTVERHSAYFGMISLGLAPLAAFLINKFGWTK